MTLLSRKRREEVSFLLTFGAGMVVFGMGVYSNDTLSIFGGIVIAFASAVKSIGVV